MPAGSKPGEHRGGRVSGTPNKVTQESVDRIDEVMKKHDCDPLEAMILIGKEAWSQGDLKLAGNMFRELAQYVAPKRRSIEIRGASEKETITFSWASSSNDVMNTSPIDSKSALIEQR